jgi:hypothetical protein
MRKLISHLPPVNRTVIRAVLEVFRLVLHHRRKNKLTVSGFCSELGPILLGVDKTTMPNEAVISADVLRTLITQFQYVMGTTEDPAEHDSLPLYTKKSTRVLMTSNSRARGLLQKQRTHTPHNSNGSSSSGGAGIMLVPHGTSAIIGNPTTSSSSELLNPHTTTSPTTGISASDMGDEELVSLTDGIMLKFLDLSVRSVLFEPQVRISFNYEAKIPNHLKRNYTTDKLLEITRGSGFRDQDRLGAWRPTLEEESPAPGTKRRREQQHAKDDSAAGSADDQLGGAGAGKQRRNTAGNARDRSGTVTSTTATTTTTEGGQGRRSGDDDADSSGSASSKKRTRRISINEESEPDLKVLMRTTSEDLSFSDESDRRKRHSVDPMEELLEWSTSSSDSDTANGGSTTPTGEKRRKKRSVERRTSTNSRGASSRLSQSVKERKKKVRQSGEISPHETAVTEVLDLPPVAGASVGAPTNSAAAAASASSVQTSPSANTPTTSTTTSSTATIAASSAEKPKTKGPRPKSKPLHMVIDSKTIMENAPSPPSEMPPPLATSTT